MARLSGQGSFELRVSSALRDAPHDPAAAARNGAYRGSHPVQHVPQGVGGLQLSPRPALVPGQTWRRGDQRVQILQLVTPRPRRANPTPIRWVVFRDLTHNGGNRRLREDHFMRTSRLEANP
jgi:hypothetical protein